MDYTRLPEMPNRPEPTQLDVELTGVMNLYTGLGYVVPVDISKSSLLAGVGKAFMPDQFPPVQALPGLSQHSMAYLGQEVQPALYKSARQGDERSLALAAQFGRAVGAATSENKAMIIHPPLTVDSAHIHVDNQSVPFSVETGRVVEYGMGVNGLFTHLRNIQAGAYAVTAIHRSRAEVAVLQGVTEFYGVSSAQLDVIDRGIAYRSGSLLKQQGQESTDLIIASRVHEAGSELRTGIIKGERLLRKAGLLVVRGPRIYSKGIGYDQVADQMHKSKNLQVAVDQQYDEKVGGGQVDHSRLVIASKT